MRNVRRPTRLAALAAMALVLAVTSVACRPIPETGLYSSAQHPNGDLIAVTDVTYTTAENHAGTMVPLKLDIYQPPAGGPSQRPLVILIHGGSFSGGNKSDMTSAARSYAMRGFIAVSLGYRLDPGATMGNLPRYLAAVGDAIDDGMEAVRWLRSQATTYRIDPTRIAMLGSSAGGGLALGVAATDDATPGGPLAAWSPKINAAVSTGATLTMGFDAGLMTADAGDAPSMLFHYETDTATSWTGEYAAKHCTYMAAVDVPCQMRISPGSGHTIGLGAGSTQWTNDIGPFIWNHLRLHPPA
jgi:acetyl esterase/lipase